VHALGEGVLVAEIQTPSDITYRTYDWGRIDPVTGRPRPLHLEAALECIDFAGPQPEPTQPPMDISADNATIRRVTQCESFVINRVEMKAGARRRVPGGQPIVWVVLDGAGRLDGPTPTAFVKGDVILLPAGMPAIETWTSTPTTYLEVTVPH
jgi:mannose-6-phosphate isomerase